MRQSMVIVLAVLLLGCSDTGVKSPPSTITQQGKFVLRYGEEAVIQGTTIRIRFADVDQDSRCPADVICIWTGNAGVVLEVSGVGSPSSIVVNTTVEPRKVMIAGYEVSLEKLDPYPDTRYPFEKKDYRAMFAITSSAQ